MEEDDELDSSTLYYPPFHTAPSNFSPILPLVRSQHVLADGRAASSAQKAMALFLSLKGEYYLLVKAKPVPNKHWKYQRADLNSEKQTCLAT